MIRTACKESLCLCKVAPYVIMSAKGSHCNYSIQTTKEHLSNSDVIAYGLQNGHVAVVPDWRMFTWLWYWTAEWSLGCGIGLQTGHVAVVSDCRMVTWLWYRNAEWSRGCGI